jgi:hypothetical protein
MTGKAPEIKEIINYYKGLSLPELEAKATQLDNEQTHIREKALQIINATEGTSLSESQEKILLLLAYELETVEVELHIIKYVIQVKKLELL